MQISPSPTYEEAQNPRLTIRGTMHCTKNCCIVTVCNTRLQFVSRTVLLKSTNAVVAKSATRTCLDMFLFGGALELGRTLSFTDIDAERPLLDCYTLRKFFFGWCYAWQLLYRICAERTFIEQGKRYLTHANYISSVFLAHESFADNNYRAVPSSPSSNIYNRIYPPKTERVTS